MDQTKKQPIKVKSRIFLRIWGFLGSAGIGLAGLWLFVEALKFESKYSIFYLGGGLLGIVYGFITFLIFCPAFTKKGDVIFNIIEGKDGRLFSGKKVVELKNIKSIRMGRHRYSFKGIFLMDILIETHENKVVRIPTYNILPEPEFYKAVELHILPYLTEATREDWISQFTEVQRKAYLEKFHQNT
ncbi:YfjD family protein [Bacillus sp. WMMC1349]|uniref:YfjD family protein n=1 Tax=Bacillus sp. WMMC1349 TaxID=2736254 RepID=UPI001554A1B6|nr:YfjD family protein [Bacillus sp. WMMC1349]NPC94632.1 YfjD family protein [Bacillus sp. WMMC1349]